MIGVSRKVTVASVLIPSVLGFHSILSSFAYFLYNTAVAHAHRGPIPTACPVVLFKEAIRACKYVFACVRVCERHFDGMSHFQSIQCSRTRPAESESCPTCA